MSSLDRGRQMGLQPEEEDAIPLWDTHGCSSIARVYRETGERWGLLPGQPSLAQKLNRLQKQHLGLLAGGPCQVQCPWLAEQQRERWAAGPDSSRYLRTALPAAFHLRLVVQELVLLHRYHDVHVDVSSCAERRRPHLP